MDETRRLPDGSTTTMTAKDLSAPPMHVEHFACGGRVGFAKGGLAPQSFGGKLMDGFQSLLDMVGVVDPTGIADVANAGISTIRAGTDPDRRSQHLANAGISLVSAVPFGDAAKAGKLGKLGGAAEAAHEMFRGQRAAMVGFADGGAVPQPADVVESVTAEQRAENFKKWFGDSKVVNEDGTPKTLYHGTQKEFDEFKATSSRAKRSADAERVSQMGHFASDKSGLAALYANGPFTKLKGKKGRVMELHMALQNPKEMELGEFYATASKSLREQLIADGHDGVIARGGEKYGSEYVAFHPHQIKSATGNRGTFDPKDNRIGYATGGLVDPHPEVPSFGKALGTAAAPSKPAPLDWSSFTPAERKFLAKTQPELAAQLAEKAGEAPKLTPPETKLSDVATAMRSSAAEAPAPIKSPRGKSLWETMAKAPDADTEDSPFVERLTASLKKHLPAGMGSGTTSSAAAKSAPPPLAPSASSPKETAEVVFGARSPGREDENDEEPEDLPTLQPDTADELPTLEPDDLATLEPEYNEAAPQDPRERALRIRERTAERLERAQTLREQNAARIAARGTGGKKGFAAAHPGLSMVGNVAQSMLGSLARRRARRGYAGGGHVSGAAMTLRPPAPEDTVAAMLAPGEVVLNEGQQESVARQAGVPKAEVFSKAKVPGFAGGGKVPAAGGDGASTARPTGFARGGFVPSAPIGFAGGGGVPAPAPAGGAMDMAGMMNMLRRSFGQLNQTVGQVNQSIQGVDQNLAHYSTTLAVAEGQLQIGQTMRNLRLASASEQSGAAAMRAQNRAQEAGQPWQEFSENVMNEGSRGMSEAGRGMNLALSGVASVAKETGFDKTAGLLADAMEAVVNAVEPLVDAIKTNSGIVQPLSWAAKGVNSQIEALVFILNTINEALDIGGVRKAAREKAAEEARLKMPAHVEALMRDMPAAERAEFRKRWGVG